MTALLESLVATQNQLPPLFQPQVTVISEIVTSHVVSTGPTRPPHQYQMPAGYPWGMPLNYMPQNFNPSTETPLVNQVPPFQPVMVTTPPVVHDVPQVEDPIYHNILSENLDVYERMDGFHDKFQ